MRTSKQNYDKVSEIFNKVSFRKFGNAFRKHIDSHFKAEYNLKSVGGYVDANFTWSECAAYIIGDGDYSMNDEQFNNFISEF